MSRKDHLGDHSGDNDPINSQFGTCLDSWAVVTCAKLWLDWPIKIKLEQAEFLQVFNYEPINILWIPVPLSCFLVNYTDVIMNCPGVSIRRQLHCLFNHVLKRTSRKTSKFRVTFVRGIHRWPVDSPHKGPVKRKIFPFDDVIMSPTHHVTIDSEDPVLQALQGHPFDRQAALLDLAVVTVLVQVPGQAEVSNLYHQLRTHPAHRNNLHHLEFTEEKFSKTSPSSQFPTLKHKLRHLDEILHHWRYRMS